MVSAFPVCAGIIEAASAEVGEGMARERFAVNHWQRFVRVVADVNRIGYAFSGQKRWGRVISDFGVIALLGLFKRFRWQSCAARLMSWRWRASVERGARSAPSFGI